MKFSSYNIASVTLVIAIIFALGRVGAGSLQVGFYNGRCNNKTLDIQAFIEAEVKKQFNIDRTLLPGLLRLQFHDCFVTGCDASILIAASGAERDGGANVDVRGFEFIDALKVKVEAICPRIVSCADIIAIATKAVLQAGGGPNYLVQTGRRDGLRSKAQDVNLPGPSMSVTQAFEFFRVRGFSLEGMVVLLGCHTVGKAQCAFFEDRLYTDNSGFDRNMDESLRKKLISICSPKRRTSNTSLLDQSELPFDKFDASFYNQTVFNRGLLPIDQLLARDRTTSAIVRSFVTNPATFNPKLAQFIVQLQAVGVLTGNQGNVRKVCSKFNNGPGQAGLDWA